MRHLPPPTRLFTRLLAVLRSVRPQRAPVPVSAAGPVVVSVLAWALAGACLLGGAALPAAAANTHTDTHPHTPASTSADTRLRCEVAYLPAQQVWVRKVVLTHSGKRLRTVAIDGVAVYSFALSGPVVLTSLDNERIQLDVSQPAWTSDFRGLASGRGVCALVP